MLWLNIIGFGAAVALVGYEIAGGKPMFVRNAWYVAAWDHEVTREMRRRIILDEPVVLFRTRRRQGGGAGRPLLPPPGAAVDGQAGRQHRALPVSRAAVRFLRQVRQGALPGHGPGFCPSAVVSRRRKEPLDLDLDRRPGEGRPGADRGLPLAGRPGLALRRQLPARRRQLPAGGREPARHHAPALPASEHARHRRVRALGVRREARRRPHHRDALADERAAGRRSTSRWAAFPTA